MVWGEHLFFKLERRAVAERAVAAVRVVEGLDVIENQQSGGGAGAGALSEAEWVEGGGVWPLRHSVLSVATKLSARALS